MRGRDIGGERVGVCHVALTDADRVHARAQVHAPDGLGAQLPHVEPEVRRVEVLAPPSHEVGEVLARLRREHREPGVPLVRIVAIANHAACDPEPLVPHLLPCLLHQVRIEAVAADARAPRDGRFLEVLGTYTATGTNAGVTVKLERVEYWLGQGAKAVGPEAFLSLLPIKVATNEGSPDTSWLLTVLNRSRASSSVSHSVAGPRCST